MLTDIKARSFTPKEKPYKRYDADGLYLEIAPNGTKRWRFRYRFAGKEKRISLGVYQSGSSPRVRVGLKEARAACQESRSLLQRGIDPSQQRQIAKAHRLEASANSFEAIAREWHQRHARNWAANHSGRILSRLVRDVFPLLGSRPISDITAPELLAVIRRIESRGALESAHRTLAHCGQIFRYAVSTGRAARDIGADLKGALPPAKTVHFAAATDPDRAAKILKAIDEYQGTLPVQAALRLAPILFVRPGELRMAKWADIDLEAKEWRYIVPKTNTEHIVPLAEQAIEILRGLHRLTGRGEYVFPSGRSNLKPMSNNAILAALRTSGIPKEEMTGHGFRAMARTLLDEVLGFRPEIIEHQLAHAVRDPLGRAYNRTTFLPERHNMMQAWADYLDSLKSDNGVIPLKPRRQQA